ncbi:hypothetical protein MSAN_00259500 [Mycena sanguinolenta]|uniref:Uncharacterized protein n=1 Tax=Mycena sanguinolenta TaxID=230812 RepID=A0A8H6ZMU0_9AGAR|nr:hypothetical protein MSAN_00259500 [Mycena sanguinolenta]
MSPQASFTRKLLPGLLQAIANGRAGLQWHLQISMCQYWSNFFGFPRLFQPSLPSLISVFDLGASVFFLMALVQLTCYGSSPDVYQLVTQRYFTGIDNEGGWQIDFSAWLWSARHYPLPSL